MYILCSGDFFLSRFPGDGTVTNAEFVELWMTLTSQTKALANAYFHLADLNDDKIINIHDFDPIYHVFDLNRK